MTTPPLACVILAAGRGTRMKSDTPKLLHPACGRPVLQWTLRAILELEPARTVVVVPPDGDPLRAVLLAAGGRGGHPGAARWAPATRPAAPAPPCPASPATSSS